MYAVVYAVKVHVIAVEEEQGREGVKWGKDQRRYQWHSCAHILNPSVSLTAIVTCLGFSRCRSKKFHGGGGGFPWDKRANAHFFQGGLPNCSPSHGFSVHSFGTAALARGGK